MDMFIDEFSKSSHFRLRKGVHQDDGRDGTVFQVDFQIVRMMWRKCISFAFTEDISKVVVFLGNVREVGIGRYRSGFASDGGSEKDRLKLCTPGNCNARANAAPLINEMCGAEMGSGVGIGGS